MKDMHGGRGRRSLLFFGIGAVAAQLPKGIVHLQNFCAVLGDWVFIKSGKGRNRGLFIFGVRGVLGKFYIGYETLVETLFSIRHIGYLNQNRQLITNRFFFI